MVVDTAEPTTRNQIISGIHQNGPSVIKDMKEDGSQVLRGMSQDQVNKYAAFQFLDEIKKRKSSSSLTTQQSDETGDTESGNPVKMTKV